ncbi:MAG: choice-of-anchor Q domain-containing protein [Solirubrobacteraceae bacterium]
MGLRRHDRRALGVICATGFLVALCPPAGAATLRVTTKTDGLGRGCSLREAITAADSPGTGTPCGRAGPRANTIVLRAGRYRLSIGPRGADDISTGDLDVTARGRLTIVGAGRGETVIDARGLGDRVLAIAGSGPVTLRGLTITGGHLAAATAGPPGTGGLSCTEGGGGGDGGSAVGGGGIYNIGTLSLARVSVTGNTAGAGGDGGNGAGGCLGGAGGQGGGGGGISNWGRLTIVDSSIHANHAGAGGAGGSGGGAGGPGGSGGVGGSGGGIFNQGAMTVKGSVIYDNRAGAGGEGGAAASPPSDGAGGTGGPGGGIFSADGTLGVTNTTLAGNTAGRGGSGGASAGQGGHGGDGGGIRVSNGLNTVTNATVVGNAVGAGGTSTSGPGARGSGGAISVYATFPQDDMRLRNTIISSSRGAACSGNIPAAIGHGGYNLSFGDRSCPGKHRNPRLGRLQDNGGPTATMALRSGSPAINRVPGRAGGCPAADQRGVQRPQGGGCDAGAFEFAAPRITIVSPRRHGSYERGSRVRVRYRCTEGGVAGLITSCRATLPPGHLIRTHSVGSRHFTVTAVDRSGHRTRRTVRYSVWAYVNPMRAIQRLRPERIDMGVDYAGSGPLLALGSGRVLGARNNDDGSVGCWGFCWPGGGIVVYRLTDGPFAGKYVFVAENITVSVRAGQRVRPGQRIAVLHYGSPNMETGWASGHAGQPLSIARGDDCPCGDPGGWSTIEGRNFNQLLVRLGARSGRLQPNPPRQKMPRGWPVWR